MRKLAIAAAAALFVTSGALAAPSPKDTPPKAKND